MWKASDAEKIESCSSNPQKITELFRIARFKTVLFAVKIALTTIEISNTNTLLNNIFIITTGKLRVDLLGLRFMQPPINFVYF